MSRRAVTLLELVIVVGILGVLIGLTLGGIQKARQASLRADSSNRLRQIGLSLQDYESERGLWPSTPGEPLRVQIGTDGYYIDYLGRGSHFLTLYPNINPGQAAAVFHLELSPYVNIRFPEFMDPADPTLGFKTEAYSDSHRSSYVCNWQVFGDDKRAQPQRVTDGRSNTIAYSTRFANRCGGKVVSPTDFGVFNDLMQPKPFDSRTTFADGGPGSSLSGRGFADPGAYPMDYPVVSAAGLPTTGSRNRTFIVTRDPEFCNYRVPTSPHPGGLLVGLCDGSVRFLGQSISQESFWGLVTPAAGDIANLD